MRTNEQDYRGPDAFEPADLDEELRLQNGPLTTALNSVTRLSDLEKFTQHPELAPRINHPLMAEHLNQEGAANFELRRLLQAIAFATDAADDSAEADQAAHAEELLLATATNETEQRTAIKDLKALLRTIHQTEGYNGDLLAGIIMHRLESTIQTSDLFKEIIYPLIEAHTSGATPESIAKLIATSTAAALAKRTRKRQIGPDPATAINAIKAKLEGFFNQP